jgi:hypothetical protein
MATVTPNTTNLSPSAVQVATSYNYVSSNDLVASGSSTNLIHQRDVDEQLIKRYGDQGITGLLELHGAKKECTNNLFEHYEEDLIHNSFSGTMAADGSSEFAVLTITAGLLGSTNSALRDGDVILGSNDKMYVVTARSAYNTFDVKDVSGDDTAAVSSAITFSIVGNAWAEGTAQPEGLSPRVNHYSNYTQIIKETFEVTGSEATNVTYLKVNSPEHGSGYLWYLKGEADTYKRFQDYCELACVLGRQFTAIYDGQGDTAGNQVYGTQGLLDFIDSSGQEMNLGSSAITMADFDAAVKSLDKYRGAKEMALYAGINLSLDVDDLLAAQGAYAAGGANYGTFANNKDMALNLGFNSFSRGGYTFHKKTYDLFNHPALLGADNMNYNGYGMCIPMDSQKDAKSGEKIPSLRIRYKAANGYSREMEHWLTGSAVLQNKTNQTDTLQCNYRSERGFEGFAPNRFLLFKKS